MGDWVAWFLSGSVSALVLLSVGVRIAPSKRRVVKRVLASIVIVVGLMSALGSFLGGGGWETSLTGVAMILVGIVSFKMTVDDLLGMTGGQSGSDSLSTSNDQHHD